ncbi:MAG: group 1 truncated hemoglobin [Bdellovibrionota bacterium]
MTNIKLSSPRLTALFADVGGEQGLERVLLNFYEKMSRDLLIGFFFEGKDIKDIALKQKSFLMRAWGVTPSYQGKSPADAHKQLPRILSGHFDRRLVILAETLREFGLNDESIELWINFEKKFRQAVQDSSTQ